MKKILVCLLFVLTGCTSKNIEPTSTPIITPTPVSTPIPTISITATPTSSTVFEIPEGEKLYRGGEENQMFTSIYGFAPSFIRVFANGNSIAIDFEGGETTTYFYEGELTELAENIYSSYGNYGMEKYQHNQEYVGTGIDFYIVLKENKCYAVFEKLTLEELLNYESEIFYKLSPFK